MPALSPEHHTQPTHSVHALRDSLHAPRQVARARSSHVNADQDASGSATVKVLP
jgi:hypothetical protein